MNALTSVLRDRDDLQSIIPTTELYRRPRRTPNHAAENRTLVALAQGLTETPDRILQILAETALDLCHAQSAGISLLEKDGRHFHWPVVVGIWAAHVGGGTPRDFGPCGAVLDRDTALLFSHPERDFPYLAAVAPGIEEALLIPFYVDGQAVGTIWVIAHDQSRCFDAEDLRVMANLSTFAATVYHTLVSMDALRDSEQRYGTLFDAMPVAAFVCDAEGVIQSFNRRAVELWGREPQRGVERYCGSLKLYLMDGSFLPHARSPIVEVMRTGVSATNVQVFIERPDGSRVAVIATFSALRDAHDQIVGAITCFDDITARVMSERRLAERIVLDRARSDWLRALINAQEDERRKMARELHDEMGQHLTGLMLGLQTLRTGEPEGGARLIARLQGIVSDIDAGVRRLARDLRPAALDDLGLVTALSNHVDEWSRQFDIAADFSSRNCDCRLAPAIETSLYRIVQEALTNVARHAQARHASVVVECRADEVVVIVEDDGRGIEPDVVDAASRAGHFGLTGIRERAALLGGRAVIESSSGGTSVFVSLPSAMAPPDPDERIHHVSWSDS